MSPLSSWIFAGLAIAGPSPDSETEPSAPAPAREQDERPLVEALEAFERGDLDSAIQWFERGYELSPQPNILFNIARVYEEKGDLEQAIGYYRRFVGQAGVELENREAALARIHVLRAALGEFEATRPDPNADAGAGSPSPLEVSPASIDTDRPKPNKKALRIAGGTLLGAGAGALIVAGVFGGLALQDQRALGDLEYLDDWDDLNSRAQTRSSIADGLFVGGGTLAFAGLVVLITGLQGRRKPASMAWTPWWSADGGGLQLRRRF